MLSTRYLHLHEALGLGPMWLQRGAKVLPAAAEATRAKATDSPPAVAPAANAAAAPATAPSHARRAAIAAVGGVQAATSAAVEEPSEKALAPAEPIPAPVSAADDEAALVQALAGKVTQAQIMVVSICPAPEDSVNGQLFSGSVGVLLDNMLAAIGLRAADAHKTSWVQDAPVFSPNPADADIRAALPRVQAELALSQAKAVLLLGQVFQKPEQAAAIEALCRGIPYFIIPHPARLLRQPQLKAQAWQQLKKLRLTLADHTPAAS
ncbi:MAG: uracil-DNA glycosylase family protein [Neisseria sp.]|nr:uracil-DNA glycosylase family protein [Neisseria sp.]